MIVVFYLLICSSSSDSVTQFSEQGHFGNVKQKSLFNIIATKLIRAYQVVISPRQGDVCNFIPSCSHYTYEAIEKKGIIKGMLMGADRLERCNYFAWHYKNKYYEVKFDKTYGYKLYDPVK